jgi:AAR2 protein
VAAGGFKGFKMVPPGPHFLSYNAASRSGDFAPTVAQLLHLAGRQVLVRRWSPQQEMLLPLSDEDEVGCPGNFGARVRRWHRIVDASCSGSSRCCSQRQGSAAV